MASVHLHNVVSGGWELRMNVQPLLYREKVFTCKRILQTMCECILGRSRVEQPPLWPFFFCFFFFVFSSSGFSSCPFYVMTSLVSSCFCYAFFDSSLPSAYFSWCRYRTVTCRFHCRNYIDVSH